MASSVNALLKKLQAAVSGGAETIPKGYMTRAQWAKKWKLKDCRTSELLRAGVRDGIVLMKQFRVQTAMGIKPVPHYLEK